MPYKRPTFSRIFQNFFLSEKSSGILLIACTLLSLGLANSAIGSVYADVWLRNVGGLSIEHWVNDALMALFFLFIGLELKRELYNGELSDRRNAMLPIFAALGGMAIPALFHFILNVGTPGQAGFGIPMATDIAFALGVLALLGNRVPLSLKIFVTAFAVIDDLGAIIIIAVFYTKQLSTNYLLAAIAVWSVLYGCNRLIRVQSLTIYLLGGALMWAFMLKSGVHATIAGVMLAFAIPFSSRADDAKSPSHKLEHFLHRPVAFFILPLFALANTAIVIGSDWLTQLSEFNSLGIIAGLTLGKPLGVFLLCWLAVASGACRLPGDMGWRHVLGAGILGGIGFTMSIFITNLAFSAQLNSINSSKMAIIFASIVSGFAAYVWLSWVGRSRQ